MTYTSAKLAGCNIDFLDMKTLNNDEELKNAIKGYDLISFGLKSSYYALGMKVVNFAKEQNSKVIIGGYHVTAAPQELLENPNIDYILHGESELTFPKFLKNPSNFEREIYGEKPKNLDSLPFMDRSIYQFPIEDCKGWWFGGKQRMISVMAARGCPFKCAFCQPIEDNHFGKVLRRRTVGSLINELKYLKQLYNPDCIMIHDDTFFIQPKWIEEFIELYPEIKLPFWASARADGICENLELFNKVVKVGWDLVSVGFESGSQRMLDKMKKGTTVQQNLEAAKIIKSSGAKIYANYMLGLPWETREDILATAKMADSINAEMPSWAFFTPYPGCELGQECIDKGWSLLDRTTYDRCPSGKKVKNVDYDFVNKILRGYREPETNDFCDIIIPTYENEDLTIQCLESIRKNTKEGTYRVIWVDNNSKIRSKIEQTIVNLNHLSIMNKENLGFVGAINKGLEQSTSPFVCLLNNDTIVSPNWLEKLISALKKDPKLGIVGAITAPPPEPTKYDSHHCVSHIEDMYGKRIFPSYTDLESFNKEIEQSFSGQTADIPFVAFLCAVIKREVIEKVGLLDPNYAMGMYDDNDYNIATRRLGYTTKLLYDTCIWHKGRSTFKLIQATENFDVDELLKKNRLYMNQKWSLVSITDDILIISRAIYNSFGEKEGLGILTQNRLKLMQRYFINSLKNQTDQDFVINLFLGEENNITSEKIKSLDWSRLRVIFTHTNGLDENWTSSASIINGFGKESEKGCPEYIVRTQGHPMTNIMVRMDTDDWVTPGWISHIRHTSNAIKEPNFLINYQILGQSPDGRLYNYSFPHNRNRISPFLVVVQKLNQKISPYSDFHLNMGRKFQSVYTVPPGYCFMVVHGSNMINKSHSKDSFIEAFGEARVTSIQNQNQNQVMKKEEVSQTSKKSWRERIK
jgi:radical SAM superfamily enzyme YgiQ (UPF0313 family)